MNDAAPKPPPVVHHLRCTCERCCAERRAEAEARRYREEQRRDARREELAGRVAAFFEAGPVKVRKPSPGTLRALVAMSRRRRSA